MILRIFLTILICEKNRQRASDDTGGLTLVPNTIYFFFFFTMLLRKYFRRFEDKKMIILKLVVRILRQSVTLAMRVFFFLIKYLRKCAIKVLLQFPTSNLYEIGFSAMSATKSKFRKRPSSGTNSVRTRH